MVTISANVRRLLETQINYSAFNCKDALPSFRVKKSKGF
jgi:hypothetical protein